MSLKVRRERTVSWARRFESCQSLGGGRSWLSLSCPWKVVELKRPKDTTERTYISDVSMRRGASARDSRKQGKGEAEESGEGVALRQCFSNYLKNLSSAGFLFCKI